MVDSPDATTVVTTTTTTDVTSTFLTTSSTGMSPTATPTILQSSHPMPRLDIRHQYNNFGSLSANYDIAIDEAQYWHQLALFLALHLIYFSHTIMNMTHKPRWPHMATWLSRHTATYHPICVTSTWTFLNHCSTNTLSATAVYHYTYGEIILL